MQFIVHCSSLHAVCAPTARGCLAPVAHSMTCCSLTCRGSLSSVLEHCMYCGMSLARVGLDFRGLLPPVFEACILAMFSKVGPSPVLAVACA